MTCDVKGKRFIQKFSFFVWKIADKEMVLLKTRKKQTSFMNRPLKEKNRQVYPKSFGEFNDFYPKKSF